MNHFDTKSVCVRCFRRTFVLLALLLPAATAGGGWLAPRLVPTWSAAALAWLGASFVSLLFLPVLGYGFWRLARAANDPRRVRAEQIIAHAAEGILTINRSGLVLSLNPAAEHSFGYSTAEARNLPLTQLLEEPSNPRQGLPHDSLPVGGTVLGLAAGAREMTGRRKNGEEFPLEVMASSMVCGDELITIAVTRDVSKRKRVQRYLLAHYAATATLAEARPVRETLPRILQAVC
jgi:PAS domain S-box-containing protein